MTHSLLLTLFLGMATLSTTVVAGILFTFATLIMPGIGKLDSRTFLRTFQEIDGIIQAGQPLFGLIWLGSILSTLAAAVIGCFELAGWQKWSLIIVASIYVLGVQLPTFAVNLPRNHRIQALQLETVDESSLARERNHFEGPWNRWNQIRTGIAFATAIGLLVLTIDLLRTPSQ